MFTRCWKFGSDRLDSHKLYITVSLQGLKSASLSNLIFFFYYFIFIFLNVEFSWKTFGANAQQSLSVWMLDNQCGQLLQFPGESAVAVELLSALARQESTLAKKSATIIMGKSWKTEVRRGLSEELSLPDIFYISTLPGKYLGTQTHLMLKTFWPAHSNTDYIIIWT